MVALADRQTGKTLGVTFWESEEALRQVKKRPTGCARTRRRP